MQSVVNDIDPLDSTSPNPRPPEEWIRSFDVPTNKKGEGKVSRWLRRLRKKK
jgi:hypothetical protein